MMPDPLTDKEKQILLHAARQALQAELGGSEIPPIDPAELTPRLLQPGASFITLTRSGDLRGCIGALQAYQPLLEDVREHAVSAAVDDYRFPPVRAEELPHINIEISCLTPPQPLEYEDAGDLLSKLRPGIDGVTLHDGPRRATFLPQVWEKVPDKAEFLDHLCHKMGARPDLWRIRKLQVETYQVEEFHE